MHINFTKTNFVLGETVPVIIIYENASDKKLVRPDPSESLDVVMHVVDSQNKEDLNYTMGMLKTTVIDMASGQFVDEMPKIKDIEIAPGASYSFSSDIHERVYLRPGKFDCFASENKTESDHVQIRIDFTKASVDYLASISMDQGKEYGRREWAMDWIGKIYPPYQLKIPVAGDSESTRLNHEKYNKQKYDEFLKWWHANRKSIEF
ncbi:MAG: hypothetical protein SRB2_03080 [Desulfobacteraceae bacterium Eth-SRB2]|nr:MAG: hypothetical protein SRB2_03080 [Desulfobacteraceae bacterium Eth-SRB2]